MDAVAGTLYGGWGFHWWNESNASGESEWVKYTANQANAMVANSSITNNPVFAYTSTELCNRSATANDVWYSLGKYVPAISSPLGRVSLPPTAGTSYNLNDSEFRHGWGRQTVQYGTSWLHSDMKDMGYNYVSPLYGKIVEIGGMK